MEAFAEKSNINESGSTELGMHRDLDCRTADQCRCRGKYVDLAQADLIFIFSNNVELCRVSTSSFSG